MKLLNLVYNSLKKHQRIQQLLLAKKLKMKMKQRALIILVMEILQPKLKIIPRRRLTKLLLTRQQMAAIQLQTLRMNNLPIQSINRRHLKTMVTHLHRRHNRFKAAQHQAQHQQ
jgi:hypothetical protein